MRVAWIDFARLFEEKKRPRRPTVFSFKSKPIAGE